ncbi:hypothetical protein JTE90_016407 [Oedothorax gibbosus]|uniref:Uncharacterized protein n=1 Tax=Oedothorax gibbosus TaxID=931172 RepID=A0AAV6TDY1_9ARAC|nr:hypothetical protein JTE90_016407 [Oedothorax gibbosus]
MRNRHRGQETRCILRETASLISATTAQYPRDDDLLQRKDNSSPGPPLDVSEFGYAFNRTWSRNDLSP